MPQTGQESATCCGVRRRRARRWGRHVDGVAISVMCLSPECSAEVRSKDHTVWLSRASDATVSPGPDAARAVRAVAVWAITARKIA